MSTHVRSSIYFVIIFNKTVIKKGNSQFSDMKKNEQVHKIFLLIPGRCREG